jgi:CubicO group peptidase (beta-lactamase class C family)
VGDDPTRIATKGVAVAQVQGHCEDRFSGVAEVLEHNLESGADVGASVAVFVDGQPVVDIWGGFRDEDHAAPWESDTITNVWSTTKTMTALCALLLADRGELDVNAPVARYWPEFKAAGKEAVEVRHLLGHTAGLAGWQEPITVEDLYDWERATSLLAAQEPWWEPGTASGYHAVTQGYLVGEVVRRITGVSLGTFFAVELAGPLGADFHIGLDPAEDGRVTSVIPPVLPDMSGLDAQSIAVRTLRNPPLDGSEPQQSAWRRAEIPAANGHGNARSVALVQSVLACGGELHGTRFLSEKGCQAVFAEQANGVDLVLGAPLRLGLGYGLSSEMMPVGPRTCYWGGWGGSVIVVDLEHRLTVSYVMNKMAPDLLGDRRGLDIILAAAIAAG